MIDWSKAKELCNEVGEEDFGEIVEVFLDEVEEELASLDGRDAECLGKSMHFLKGSALNLGFTSLAEICVEGEALAQTGHSEKIDTARIKSVYADSKRIFLGEYGG
ncbi:Hpt domain-containing protein [Rhodobacteraceae bacterium 63075]|nr:Hpt domain-containing protein [Rhodobacteraceae bacterium 63075]